VPTPSACDGVDLCVVAIFGGHLKMEKASHFRNISPIGREGVLLLNRSFSQHGSEAIAAGVAQSG
jgi:hypothetical protein